MKISTPFALLAIAGQAVAFPAMAVEYAQNLQEEAAAAGKRQLPGITPGFNAKLQKIDVSGAHAFVPPGSGDVRGPCPGLNALANHNYLPHNGVATIQQFITQTNAVYGMGLDLATFLAVFGAVFDGNLASWSIAGPTPAESAGPLLGTPQGLSGSHNKYESDGSPGRGDLYLYNGDNYRLQLSNFKALYSLQSGPNANYNLDVLTTHRVNRVAQSKSQNPYFFSAPFAGVLVQPAAYTFAYRFMANKSAEHPEGVLNRDVLKSFFAVSGDDNNLQYTFGHERIPDNWYKRAIGDEYTIPYFALDVLAMAAQHPEFLQIGGNLGKVNTFAGVDPSNLTGGVYNLVNIGKGNNLVCFGFQSAQAAAPDILKGSLPESVLASALSTVNNIVGNALSGLGCPQLTKYDSSALAQFPGYSKLKADGTY